MYISCDSWYKTHRVSCLAYLSLCTCEQNMLVEVSFYNVNIILWIHSFGFGTPPCSLCLITSFFFSNLLFCSLLTPSLLSFLLLSSHLVPSPIFLLFIFTTFYSLDSPPLLSLFLFSSWSVLTCFSSFCSSLPSPFLSLCPPLPPFFIFNPASHLCLTLSMTIFTSSSFLPPSPFFPQDKDFHQNLIISVTLYAGGLLLVPIGVDSVGKEAKKMGEVVMNKQWRERRRDRRQARGVFEREIQKRKLRDEGRREQRMRSWPQKQQDHLLGNSTFL